MRTPVLLFLFLPLFLSAQALKISKSAAKDVIDKMESYPIEIVKVKTLKKWKALDLSHEMKPQMNYNVVRVTYKTQDSLKIVIIDMHLVPIRYDCGKTME